MAGRKKPLTKPIVALLDVDNTLIFGNEPVEYNDNLIRSLLQNNIKDVYLFSSMSLDPETVKERNELIGYLKTKGLQVHGVICASDLVWQKDRQVLDEFCTLINNTPAMQDIIASLKQEKFQSLTNFKDALPGEGFQDVLAGKSGWTKEQATNYQNAVSAIRQYLATQDTSPEASQIAQSEKAYFYQLFANQKPTWMGNVVFIDDADVNINAVLAMHNKLNAANPVGHQLLTVLNRDDKKEVKNKESFYDAMLKPFAEKTLALVDIVKNYKRQLHEITGSKKKEDLLELLRGELEDCRTVAEVEEVRQDFQDTAYNTLNKHRFKVGKQDGSDKTRSAKIFDEMIEARKMQLTDAPSPSPK